MVPVAGSEAEDLAEVIRHRLAGRNPHLDAYEQAQAEFNSLSTEVEAFKRERVADRIEEAVARSREDDGKAREGIRLLLLWLEGERTLRDEVGTIVLDTPTLQRQQQPTLSFDPRLDQWDGLAQEVLDALDEGIPAPGLTPFTVERVARLG